MLPPAPPTFSTTTDCPRSGRMRSATTRATTSVDPPGGNGEMSVTGRDGNGCACASAVPAAAARIAPTSSRLTGEFIVLLPGKNLKQDLRFVDDWQAFVEPVGLLPGLGVVPRERTEVEAGELLELGDADLVEPDLEGGEGGLLRAKPRDARQEVFLRHHERLRFQRLARDIGDDLEELLRDLHAAEGLVGHALALEVQAQAAVGSGLAERRVEHRSVDDAEPRCALGERRDRGVLQPEPDAGRRGRATVLVELPVLRGAVGEVVRIVAVSLRGRVARTPLQVAAAREVALVEGVQRAVGLERALLLVELVAGLRRLVDGIDPRVAKPGVAVRVAVAAEARRIDVGGREVRERPRLVQHHAVVPVLELRFLPWQQEYLAVGPGCDLGQRHRGAGAEELRAVAVAPGVVRLVDDDFLEDGQGLRRDERCRRLFGSFSFSN